MVVLRLPKCSVDAQLYFTDPSKKVDPLLFSSLFSKRLAGLVGESLLSMKPKINREEMEIVFSEESEVQVNILTEIFKVRVIFKIIC
jgi:hypothetical protein